MGPLFLHLMAIFCRDLLSQVSWLTVKIFTMWIASHNCGEKCIPVSPACYTSSFLLYSGIDGEWGDWNEWSSCSVTCGSGVQTRDRACDNPAPQNGGLNCTGDGEESMNCTISDYCLPSFYGNILLVSTPIGFMIMPECLLSRTFSWLRFS